MAEARKMGKTELFAHFVEHFAAVNISPRSLQGRALSAICGLIGRLMDRWGRLTSVWGSKWRPAAVVGSIAHRQAA